MCFSSPSYPTAAAPMAPPPPPPAPAPAPQSPDKPVQAAGTAARSRAAAAQGAIATIQNVGGPTGLVDQASTTANAGGKTKLGG
jgi:hypothetical protein